MPRIFYMPVFILTLFFVLSPAMAGESKDLRKQQQAAQKERQAQKKERSKELSEATKEFKEYAREIKMEYLGQVKDLDTEFDLRRIELQAEHDAKVAGEEAEYQMKLSDLFMIPQGKFNEKTIEQLQVEGKAYSDELFNLKKQSAEKLHQELILNEERKNELLTERDHMALDKAFELKLTKDYAPILATPIGDALTKNEEKWNKRENKEIIKIKERNRKTLSEFRNGEKLRNWKIQTLNEDFRLTWDEKGELHSIDSQHLFFNTMYMQTSQGEQFDQQEIMSKLAEDNKKKKLIQIEYKKIRDQNRIKRREEKKDILSS